MSGFDAFFLLPWEIFFFGLSEPTNKTSVDQTLKEITDQRLDAFMQGISQRKFDRHGRLETTLTATSPLILGRVNAKLINPNSGSNGIRDPLIEANAVNQSRSKTKYSLKNVVADRLENGKIPALSGET